MAAAARQAATQRQDADDVHALLEAVFGCVAYLREFYREDVFERRRVGDLGVQRIVPGASPQSDALLAWLRTGCMDALRRGYLRSVLLTVVADRARAQQTVLEAYSVRVEYAGAETRLAVSRAAESRSKDLCSTTVSPTRSADWTADAARMLRALCVLLQTLPPLPARKYVAMHMAYYDSVTPASYEPPGFVASVFDAANLFERSEMLDGRGILRHDFARVAVGSSHALTVRVESIDCDSAKADAAVPGGVAQAKGNVGSPGSIATAQQTETGPVVPMIDANGSAQNADAGFISPEGESDAFVSPVQIKSKGAVPTVGVKRAAPPVTIAPAAERRCASGNEEQPLSLDFSQPARVVERRAECAQKAPARTPPNTIIDAKKTVRCMCGDAATDMDMICCDVCGTWQHTPCAGFCSNADRRIPERYACQRCVLRPEGKLAQHLSRLACLRRAISIVYADGLDTIAALAARLDCGCTKAATIVRRLEAEGMLVRGGGPSQGGARPFYAVQRTPAARERIRFYFGLDVRAHPEIAACLRRHESQLSQRAERESAQSRLAAPHGSEAGGSQVPAPGVRLSSVAEPRSCH